MVDQNAQDQIHLTVATVVEKNGKYLIVAERCQGERVYNQPAGHVEPGEKLADAAIRETLEETGWTVALTGLISISTFTAPSNGVTYHRVCFAAEAIHFDPTAELDQDIERALWLSYEELMQYGDKLRSPLVLQAVEDVRRGNIYPLSLVRE